MISPHNLEASLDDNPDDTLVRLAYADALEESGQTEQAEFQRLLVKYRVWPQKNGHISRLLDGTWRLFSDAAEERPCHIGHICKMVKYDDAFPPWKELGSGVKWTRKELEEDLRLWSCWKRFVEKNDERPEEG